MSIRFYQHHLIGREVDQSLDLFTFPGGEEHLRRVKDGPVPEVAMITGSASIAEDLVALSLWADFVRAEGGTPRAHIAYLPAARADRGAPFGAAVYADFINAAGLEEVVVFDPHSVVAPSCVKNVRVVEPTAAIVASALAPTRAVGFSGVIAPDKGAVDRAQRVADAAGLPLFRADKTRDFDTGQITGFSIEELPREGKLLVVDDICDGGGTFRALAAESGVGPERLELWVSHGIFSGKAFDLHLSYSRIWTTDSHVGAHRSGVPDFVIPVTNYLTEGDTAS